MTTEEGGGSPSGLGLLPAGCCPAELHEGALSVLPGWYWVKFCQVRRPVDFCPIVGLVALSSSRGYCRCRFRDAQVLESDKALLYWDHDHGSTASGMGEGGSVTGRDTLECRS